MSLKGSLLERAAENAFRNQDLHLANALYNEIDHVAAPVAKSIVNLIDALKSACWDLQSPYDFRKDPEYKQIEDLQNEINDLKSLVQYPQHAKDRDDFDLKKLFAEFQKHAEESLKRIPAWATEANPKSAKKLIAAKKKTIEKALKVIKDPASVKKIQDALDASTSTKAGLQKLVQEYISGFKAPSGWKETKPDVFHGDKNARAIKSDDDTMFIEFVFGPATWGGGKVSITGEGWYSLDGKSHYSLGRRGIDSGFNGDDKEYPNVMDAVKKAVSQCEDKKESLKSMNVSLTVAGKTWKMTSEGLEQKKKALKERGSFSLAPSGMGTGYTVMTKPSRYSTPVEAVTAKLLGFDKLFFETYDHD